MTSGEKIENINTQEQYNYTNRESEVTAQKSKKPGTSEDVTKDSEEIHGNSNYYHMPASARRYSHRQEGIRITEEEQRSPPTATKSTLEQRVLQQEDNVINEAQKKKEGVIKGHPILLQDLIVGPTTSKAQACEIMEVESSSSWAFKARPAEHLAHSNPARAEEYKADQPNKPQKEEKTTNTYQSPQIRTTSSSSHQLQIWHPRITIKAKPRPTYYVEFPEEEQPEENNMKHSPLETALVNEIHRRLSLKRGRDDLNTEESMNEMGLHVNQCSYRSKKIKFHGEDKEELSHLTDMAEEAGPIKPHQSP